MTPIRLLCLLLATAGLPCQAAGDADPQKLQGRWVLMPEVREVVAANCQTLSYEIDASTLTLRSGEMVLVTRYEVETPGPEFSLRQTVQSNNGKRNCFGAIIPALAGQSLDKIRIDLVGERIRIHQRSSRGSNRNIEMVRNAD
jgi:hypothetical protein